MNEAVDLAGNDQFLVGGNDDHLDRRIRRVDESLLSSWEVTVRLLVDSDTQSLERLTDALADLGCVFADAGREGDDLSTTHLEEEGTGPVADAVDKDIKSQVGIRMVIIGSGTDVADIIACLLYTSPSPRDS